MRTLLSFGLMLLLAPISRGQVLFEHTFRFNVPCHADQMVRLPDGDLMIAGVMDTSLFIARATTAGDTLWTRNLGHHVLRVDEMELLDDSTLILATGELMTVKTNGTDLNVIGMADDISVLAPDTFMFANDDVVTSRTLSGDEFWTWASPGAIPYTCRVDRILAMPDGGAQVLGVRRYDDGLFINTMPWMARVSNSGQLVDSLTLQFIHFNATGKGWKLIRIDGGFLGVAWSSTVDNLVFRGTDQGDTLWTTHQGIYQSGPDGYFGSPHTLVERPTGNIMLVGEGTGIGFTGALLEMTSEGDPLCLYLQPRDTLSNEIDYKFDRDLYTDATVLENDEVIVLASYAYPYYGGQPVDSTYWGLMAFGNPCLPLAMPNKDEPTVVLYPQPSTSVLTVQLATSLPVEAVLYDALGRQVLRTRLVPARTDLDVGSLGSGIYALHIIHRDGTWNSHQVLIEH